MIGRLVLLAAASLLIAAQGTRAQGAPMPLCPGSAAAMRGHALLRAAVKAAYPNVPERRDDPDDPEPDPCVHPYQANAFGDAVVLFTFSQKPGDACHGCGAKISATFLRRDGDRLVTVAHHHEFTEAGSWGDVTAITPVRVGTDDGIAVEGGGTFQGETTSVLQVFVFRNGEAVRIGPEDGIVLSHDTCGAGTAGRSCTALKGSWTMDAAGRLTVSYRGKKNGRSSTSTVVYERRGDALEPVSGTPLAF
ncbi:hypothetical protein [Microvirga thermotolerans]|uniref:Uncharacterized protein n=1 Tax=Microvirga thermotolerans TaxID=2651334 RepID=A0A5P9JUC5_9HYPH|nr:hypothetical protein [Microvirga thermotolerans]QFU15721.1 hypothetical protein GDR74_05525 [Microvirga thermotolerans]